MHSYFIKGISLVVALLFLSCSSDSSDDNIDEPSGDSYMRTKFGDLEWEADNIQVQLTVVPDEGGQRFDITAKG